MSETTQPGQDSITVRPLNIWIVTDNKPGHLNQLKGLYERIAEHTHSTVNWIATSDSKSRWVDCLLRRYNHPLNHATEQNALANEKPDIVIGAGHSTHKDVLAIKRHFRCFSVLLMKPSLPSHWFGATIIPEHDNPTPNSHTLITKGVLNTISPTSSSSVQETNKTKGLILIGGTSKHYHWDATGIAQQVIELTQANTAIQWTLSDSRRTGPEFLALIKQQQPNNIHVIPHAETPNGWVKEQMAQTGQIWVTPDSVSMVYEAITSGAPVGLFNMTATKNGRIVKGIKSLVDEGVVSPFSTDGPSHKISAPSNPLWESERAAVWLLQQYSDFRKTNNR